MDALLALCRSGRTGEAEPQARELLRAFPDDFTVNKILADVLVAEGKPVAAVPFYEKAAAIQPNSAEAHFALGNIHLSAGRAEAAVVHYQKTVSLRPDFAEGQSNLGAAFLAFGRFKEAADALRMAVELNSGLADPQTNLGIALKNLGRPDEAIDCLQKALELNPGDADIHNNIGAALESLDRLDEAIESYRKATALLPAYPEAQCNLGNALAKNGDHRSAIECYRKAVEQQPDFAEAHNCLGLSLAELGRHEEAEACFSKAVEIAPGFARAHNNKGITLAARKRYSEALDSYDRAVALDPDYADAHNNRGNALRALKRYEEALRSLDRAIEIRPRAISHYNKGNVLADLNRNDEAIENYGRALAIDPALAGAYHSRGEVFSRLRRHEQAIADFEDCRRIDPDYPFNRGALFYAREECCDWDHYDEDTSALLAGVRAKKPAVVPWAFLEFSQSPADQLTCAQIFAETCCPTAQMPMWRGERYDHDRIRVAYVSGDFHNHATGILMARLFELHDRTRFETIAVSYGTDDGSAMRSRLENGFERFMDVRDMGSLEIASLIHALEADIAVEVKGYTLNARPEIFAQRPAPVQVAWLAYPGTLGTGWMDYILADPIVIPEDQQRFYSEKVVYLPDTYQANDSTRQVALTVPSREVAGLPSDGFVFCCFNQNHKITPAIFDVWMRLLGQVPRSVMWLLQWNPYAARNLRREAEKRGIAGERLVFAPFEPHAEHLARHRLADLFLDTSPFNAHTTASDALWAGLPLVTCLGTTFAGRVGASLLSAVGLPELVTDSLDAYEKLSLRLASDPAALSDVRSRLNRNRSTHPLFDSERMCRHVERAYEMMWCRAQRAELPTGFSVGPIDRYRHPRRSEA